MQQYIGLDKFKAVYIVDLCHSLCEQAKAKVAAKGWTNVHVVEGDACEFAPPEGAASLVTFSYSLSSELFVWFGGPSVGARAARSTPLVENKKTLTPPSSSPTHPHPPRKP